MNTDFTKKQSLQDVRLRCLIILLVLLAIVALIRPICFFGSKFIYLAKTYSYTCINKEFLKYENDTVYTTDGCAYEDKKHIFQELVFDEPRNSVEEGARVVVYISDLTGEPFNVEIQGSYYTFSLDNSQYNSYISKKSETNHFLTFSALTVALAFFITVAGFVFFTKSTPKRGIYVLFYGFSIFIGLMSLWLRLIDSDSVLQSVLCAEVLVISIFYGATAYYLSRRILIPSLILSSTQMVFALIGTSECIRKPLDFLLQSCDSVIFSFLGALIVLLIQKMSVGKSNKLAKFFLGFDNINSDRSEFFVRYIPALILLLIELFLEYQTSLLKSGDWAGFAFMIPALFIIPPIYGLVSSICTSRVILPHVILATVCFPVFVIGALPGSRQSSIDILSVSLTTVCLITVFSLIPALCAYFIRLIQRKIRRSKEKVQTEE